MSTVKTNNVQVGQSLTATNNFTLYQPTVPDGTVRLGVGNTGATTADVITATSAGNVGIGTSSITRAFTNYNQLNINGASGANIQMQYGGSLASNIAADSNALYLQNITALVFGTGGTGTGTERMRIDSSGRVTTPAQPAFYAAGFSAGTYTSGQLINFSTAPLNRGGYFNTGANRFTAPVSGVYVFCVGIYVYAGTATTPQSIAIRLNGSEIALSGDTTMFYSGSAPSGDNMVLGSMPLSLSANDYVTLNLRTGAASIQLYPGHSFFSGYLIG